MTEPHKAPPVILYDGVCHLCDSCVQVVLKHEQAPQIHFCHLQSPSAKSLLAPFAEEIKLDTIYFIENQRLYNRSTAVLRIARYLKSPWSWMSVLMIFPQFIRDGIYNYVGKNRYRWFGHSDSCILPGVTDPSRFLD